MSSEKAFNKGPQYYTRIFLFHLILSPSFLCKYIHTPNVSVLLLNFICDFCFDIFKIFPYASKRPGKCNLKARRNTLTPEQLSPCWQPTPTGHKLYQLNSINLEKPQAKCRCLELGRALNLIAHCTRCLPVQYRRSPVPGPRSIVMHSPLSLSCWDKRKAKLSILFQFESAFLPLLTN